VVTTHASRLKAYAAETPGAVNAAMEFDDRTLESTYRLLVGLPGKSSGLSVAERLGLPRSIIDRARSLVAPEEREVAALVETLHRERAEMERKLRESEVARMEIERRRQEFEQQYQAERRARLTELSRRLEEALKRESRRWESALEEIRAEVRTQAARSLTQNQSRSQFKRLEQKLERLPGAIANEARETWKSDVAELVGPEATATEPAAVIEGPPRPGDTVHVEGMPAPGTVITVAGGGIDVEVGRLHMRVDPARVRVLVRRHTPPTGATGAGPVVSPVEAPAEINVIGQTAEEAREQVDAFLDHAFLARRFRLRVVHGHGKGILRRTLHEMFESHPHVEKFYAAPQNEGGTGATIVELKL